jgi:hypothetical protein
VVFTDLNDDGWPDIYVANDSVPNLFFRNRKDGTFVEEGLAAGLAVSGDGRAQAGMGVDAGDLNGDGLPDIIVTNFSHDHNTLYENGPPGLFTDKSYVSGLAATAGPYLGWGTGFVDLDQDGRLDIFIANGHVYPEVDKQGLGTKYLQRKQVFMNTGGKLRHATAEIGGGLLLERSSRGAAFGDYDNDGDTDILVINMNDKPTLLRNDTVTQNHWIGLKLVGTKSNRDGIGARVTVQAGARRQRTEVRGDGSYISHSDIRPRFGLGSAARVDRIEIRWPSGTVDTARLWRPTAITSPVKAAASRRSRRARKRPDPIAPALFHELGMAGHDGHPAGLVAHCCQRRGQRGCRFHRRVAVECHAQLPGGGTGAAGREQRRAEVLL